MELYKTIMNQHYQDKKISIEKNRNFHMLARRVKSKWGRMKEEDAFEKKVCSKCNQVLCRYQFPKNSKSKDGLYCYCKECHNTRKKDTWAFKNQNKQLLKTRADANEFLVNDKYVCSCTYSTFDISNFVKHMNTNKFKNQCANK